MTAKTILLIAVTAAGSAGLGYALRPTPLATPPARLGAELQATAPLAAVAERVQLANLIRTAVHEELQRSRPSAAQSAARPADPAPAPTAEQSAAQERGRDILESARRAGRWTPADRDHFHEVLAQVSDSERDELMVAVVSALNRRELKLDLDPPFRPF